MVRASVRSPHKKISPRIPSCECFHRKSLRFSCGDTGTRFFRNTFRSPWTHSRDFCEIISAHVRSLRTHRELLGLKEGDGREGDPTVPSRDCANPGSCPLFDKGSCYVFPGAPCAKPLSLYSAEN